MATLRNGESEIYFEVHGSGEPLLLIAGLASDSQSWITVVPELSKHFKTIIFDNRGAGRTKCPVTDISIEAIASDAVALLRHLSLSRAHVLGHSMGGYVAQYLAVNHPERVDKLILAATSSFTGQRNKSLLRDMITLRGSGMNMELWYRNLFYWIFSPHFFVNPDFVAENVKLAVDYPYPQTLAQFSKQVEIISRFDMSQKLSHIKAETLILTGEEDLLFPTSEVFNAFSILKRTKFVTISHAGHAMFLENQSGFLNEITGFLQ